jgi:hypothetical protein
MLHPNYEMSIQVSFTRHSSLAVIVVNSLFDITEYPYNDIIPLGRYNEVRRYTGALTRPSVSFDLTRLLTVVWAVPWQSAPGSGLCPPGKVRIHEFKLKAKITPRTLAPFSLQLQFTPALIYHIGACKPIRI